jgi:hypothetical protein
MSSAEKVTEVRLPRCSLLSDFPGFSLRRVRWQHWELKTEKGAEHPEKSEYLLHIPGNFIPARRRAKLFLPMSLNIFLIWAYWRSRLLTS